VPFCAWIEMAQRLSAKARQTEAIFNMWMGSFVYLPRIDAD
jgi:hypothetical protein